MELTKNFQSEGLVTTDNYSSKKEKFAKVSISLFLLVLSITIYYPGSYSGDSWSQYIHMTKNWCDDWFGPGMVVLWKALLFLTGKFASLFLLQMIAYWVFISMLTWDKPIRSARYWVLNIAGLLCCFIPQYLMRDSLMSVCWGIAALLMLQLPHQNKKGILIGLILLLSFYGLWLRPNALIALIPFEMAFVAMLLPRISTLKLIALGVIITTMLFAATNIMTYKVMHAHKAYPGYKLKLLDLIGISKLSGESSIPQCVSSTKTFDYNKVLQQYTPATIDNIYWSTDNPIPPPTEELNKCVQDQWGHAIFRHPVLYVRNRFEGFLFYLRVNKRLKNSEYWNTFIDIEANNPISLKQQPNKVRDSLKGLYAKLGEIHFFDPWLWLLINCGGITYSYISYKRTKDKLLKWLAFIQLSGIFYLLSQFPIYQYDQEFRYNYWLVFVVLITVGIRVGRLKQPFVD